MIQAVQSKPFYDLNLLIAVQNKSIQEVCSVWARVGFDLVTIHTSTHSFEGYWSFFGRVKMQDITLVGDFNQGWVHGMGLYTANDAIYFGQYQHGKRVGYGVEIFPDNSQYVGYFQNDKREGKGRYNFSNGARYDGSFVGNRMCGDGLYTFTNGNTYTGSMENDQFHGMGTYRFLNHLIYLEFIAYGQKGEIQGLVRMFYRDGTVDTISAATVS